MIKITVFLFWLTIFVNNCQVEYYKNLINNEIDRITNYTLKTDNSEYWENADDDRIHDYGKYDFIVVGSGSAGGIIANRLSEIRKWKILLLEAGGEESTFTNIPGMWMWTTISNKSWNYFTTPQTTYCLGMNNNQCYYPTGKTIGGTSTLNSGVHIRGNHRDFNRWESIHGNPGWSFNNVLPYFKKYEKFQIVGGDPGYHGFQGPLNVQYSKPEHNLTTTFIAANELLGLNIVDYNGANQIGVSQQQKILNRGKKVSTGRGYIDPARRRKNFKISAKSYVTKVLIKQKSAYGVIFMKNGKQFRAIARKEVILSAGALNSPQILMLSGIGPKYHLTDLGIDVIKDLPVGQYLYDQISYLVTLRSNFVDITQTLEEQIIDYLNGKGLLAYQFGSTGGRFFNIDDSSNPVPVYYNEFVPTSTSTATNVPVPKYLNYNNEVLYSLYSDANAQTDFSILVVLLHPKSVGNLTLKSNNPIDYPNININSLSDENDEDINDLYEGYKYTLNLLETEPFTTFNTHLRNVTISECENYEYDTKEYWFCIIRYLAYPGYHIVGTTRMGSNDRDYVVNYKLKVHGIKRLRVADAGIMPELVSSNTQAAVFMIAEKTADIIKHDYHF